MFNFVTFKELLEKSAFLKITAQAFEAGDFNILLRFWGVFTVHFLTKKPPCISSKTRLVFRRIFYICGNLGTRIVFF